MMSMRIYDSGRDLFAGVMNQDAQQYQIVYQGDKQNVVRIHPTDHATHVNGINGTAETAPVDILVQEAHRLYREQNYTAVLALCQNVRLDPHPAPEYQERPIIVWPR
jgi:hypothetical protein